MKKVLLLCGLFLLAGCVNVEISTNENKDNTTDNPEDNTNIRLDLGTYYDTNNMYNGTSLHEITLGENGEATTKNCVGAGACTNYKGAYSITGNSLYVHLTEFQDTAGEWGGIPRDSDVPYEYEITGNNEFEMGNQKYKLK